jgi:hypothetical protein
VFNWWPGASPVSERSPLGQPTMSPRALDTELEAPRPLDKPVAVELADTLPALGARTSMPAPAVGTWSSPSAAGSLVAPSNGSAPYGQSSPGAAGPSDPGAAGPFDPRFASAVRISGATPSSKEYAITNPSAQAHAAQAPIGVVASPQTRIASPAAVDEEALRRAASAALARERNINKVRTYPNRPGWHVNND